MDMIDPEIMVPHNLEVIWRVGRPKKGPRKNIIFGAIYYPPRARKKEKIKTHILETLHLLMARYPEAEICIGGDKNELKLDDIVHGIPGLKQVMTPPTHKTKTIDVILTTMRDSYKQVQIINPVEADANENPVITMVYSLYPGTIKMK